MQTKPLGAQPLRVLPVPAWAAACTHALSDAPSSGQSSALGVTLGVWGLRKEGVHLWTAKEYKCLDAEVTANLGVAPLNRTSCGGRRPPSIDLAV